MLLQADGNKDPVWLVIIVLAGRIGKWVIVTCLISHQQ